MLGYQCDKHSEQNISKSLSNYTSRDCDLKFGGVECALIPELAFLFRGFCSVNDDWFALAKGEGFGGNRERARSDLGVI